MADYDQIKLGTAPILDMIGLPADAKGSGLDDDQILRMFSTLKTLGEDGAPTEVDAFLRGLTRGGFSFAAGVAGAKTAATLAPPYIPLPGPFAPLGVLSKPAFGLKGFIVGSIVGDAFLGTPIADQLFKGLNEVNLTPKAEATFRAYESAGNVAPFIFMPFTAPKAMFSTVSSLRSLPLANRVTVLSADDMANPLITKYLQGKVAGTPTTRQFNTLRDKIFRTAKEAGEDITLSQAAKQAAKELNRSGRMVRGTTSVFDFAEKALVSGGASFRALSTPQKAGVLALETLAVPATGALVNIQETEYPRQPGKRVLAETVGSLAPAVSILKFAPLAYSKSKNFINRIRENKAMGRPLDIVGTQERARNRAIDDIFEIFNDHNLNPDEYLAQLEARMVDPVLKDGKIVGYELKPEFKPAPGEPKTSMFSGQFIENPAIAQLEQTVLGRGGAGMGAKFEADFVKSMEMMKGQIFALRGSGDPQLMKVASEMMQERLSLLINKRMDNAIKATVQSVQKIYPDGGPEASKLLGEKLRQVVLNQKKLFRKLERNAWSKVNPRQEVPTFYRVDQETGDFVENPVPNFIEEWDAMLSDMDDLDKTLLMAAPKFKEINARILEYKQQLGLDATDALSGALPAVAKFDEAFQNAQGLGARDSFVRLLRDAGITDEVTPENIQLIGQLETRLGRQKGKTVELIRLKRESLIAQLANQQGAQATGVVSEPLTQGNLTSLYSTLRTAATEQGPTNSNFARIANNLAEATLDDLNGGAIGNPDYAAARDISYSFNTYLKRAFGNDIIGKNARGKDVVDQDLLTSKLMSGQPDAVALKLEQISELGQQINKYASDSGYEIVTKADVADYTATTNKVLADTLRLALREIELPLEAKTGKSAAAIAAAQNEAMQQFRAKNPKIFEIFPQIGQMMDEAGDAGNFLARLKGIPGDENKLGTIKRLQKKAAQQEAFKKLTGAENPERAILKAINSENPTDELNSLVELIKAGSDPRNLRRLIRNKGLNISADALNLDAAKEGVRHSVLSLAFSKGGQYSVEGLNARGAYNMLFDKLPNADREGETVAQWMISNNIMTEKEVSGLELGLRTIIKSEAKQDVSKALIQGETPALIDMYTRILGSRLGTSVGRSMPGGRSGAAGLIEAEAGSRYLRQLTQEIPALQEYDALEKILLNPELLALALRKPRSPAEKQGIINMLLDKLGTFGIGVAPAVGQRAIPLGAQEFVEPEVSSEPPPPVGPVSSVTPTAMPAPPPVPAQRVEPPTDTLASATPVAPPPAASGPVREQYAALFPNDIASGMIRQQGTALMADGGAVRHLAAGGRADGPGSDNFGSEASQHGSGGGNDGGNDGGDQNRSMTPEERYADNARRLAQTYIGDDQNQSMTPEERYADNFARLSANLPQSIPSNSSVSLTVTPQEKRQVLSQVNKVAQQSLQPDAVIDFRQRLAAGQFDPQKAALNPAQARAAAVNPTLAGFVQPGAGMGITSLPSIQTNTNMEQPTVAPEASFSGLPVGEGKLMGQYDPATGKVELVYTRQYARGGAVNLGIGNLFRRRV
jgi:hypothetical protein